MKPNPEKDNQPAEELRIVRVANGWEVDAHTSDFNTHGAAPDRYVFNDVDDMLVGLRGLLLRGVLGTCEDIDERIRRGPEKSIEDILRDCQTSPPRDLPTFRPDGTPTCGFQVGDHWKSSDGTRTVIECDGDFIRYVLTCTDGHTQECSSPPENWRDATAHPIAPVTHADFSPKRHDDEPTAGFRVGDVWRTAENPAHYVEVKEVRDDCVRCYSTDGKQSGPFNFCRGALALGWAHVLPVGAKLFRQ